LPLLGPLGTPFLNSYEAVEYYKFLGLKQINKMDYPENKFCLYFLGYDDQDATSHGKHWSDRQGILELTHNYGTETDGNFMVNNGNEEPNRGFGHIALSVDNIQAACKRIEDAGYGFKKKLTDGRMKHIAFALDPDGYWVEIIGQKSASETEDISTTNSSTYKFNHSMLRVKDSKKSIAFYTEVMGMTLLRTHEAKEAGFNLYFLGYKIQAKETPNAPQGVNPLAESEGLLELTWNYGTENDEGFKYHDGNSEPQGFGHICKNEFLPMLLTYWKSKLMSLPLNRHVCRRS
jgi:lactoylglutathione lyase